MSEANTDRMYLIPNPQLGHVTDIYPERLTSATNEWIKHSREILKTRRRAADAGKLQPTQEIGKDHVKLAPFGAEYCPALREWNSIGYLLKWPATAIVRNLGPKAWELKPSTNFNFVNYHLMTTIPEIGEAQALSIDTGFMVVTPPGWSILFKNIPNNIHGATKGLSFAEGVIRTDQATIGLQVHAFIRPDAPKEIRIRRGDPMAILMPFKHDSLDLVVADDDASIEEAKALITKSDATFKSAPGKYQELYIDGETPSPLYPTLTERWKDDG